MSYLIMIPFVLLSVLQVCLNDAYDFHCPSQAHWKLRAKSMCMAQRNYSCLYDVNFQINVYRDKCIRPRILGPGYKYVFQPNPNRGNCKLSRFQPFIFNTTGYSDCAIIKSLCNSEGQTVYTDGTTRTDRACTCNSEIGYNFVCNPKHGCFCDPSSEDCSCYIRTNPDNRTITSKDLRCHGEINTYANRSLEDALTKSPKLKINDFDNFKYNLVCPTNRYRSNAVLCILVLTLAYPPFAVVVYIIQRFIRRWRQINTLPEDVKRLKEEDRDRYIKLMQSEKKERRYFVRIMIVGKGRVGKTCLMRRLLKERIKKNEPSTDGVDIVVQRCKININDGKWTFGKDTSDGMAERFHRAMIPNTNMEHVTQIQNESKNNESSITEVSIEVANNSRKQSENSQAEDHSDISNHSWTNSEIESSTETFKEELESKTETINELLTNETDAKNFPSFTNDIKNNIENLEKNENINSEVPVNDASDTLIENVDENKSSCLIMPMDLMSRVLSKTPNSNISSNQHALCSLWDFAGQKEFYATHQAFLTSAAIYLVVADIEDDISKQDVTQHFADFGEVGGYVDFWFDTIHCHRTADITACQPVNHYIDPPIIIVFTGKDKYKKENLDERIKDLQTQLGVVFGNQSKYHHLRDIFCLSNIMDPDEEFEKLREKISETAKQMKNWGELMPLKWILLEHLIETNKKQNDFISFSDMFKMAKHSDIGMTNIEETKVFLHFQHKVGNIIFFDDIQDFIILNPQWLVDAFRCLVSDKIDPKLQHCEDWIMFERNGQISEYLITELFKSKGGSRFLSQRDNLIKVMEKFDILVKIGETCYTMPSMMPSVPFDEICEKIGVEKSKRTSWLCLKFAFLPPAFFNHIYVWYIRKYRPMEMDNQRQSLLSLFRGIGVFDIDQSKCEKLLVTISTDIIAIQMVSFSKEEKDFGSICSNIRTDLIKQIEAIKQRFHLQISYKLHFKCSKSEYFHDTLPYEYLKSVTEYSCKEHKMAHYSKELCLPWMAYVAKDQHLLYDEGIKNSERDELNSEYTIDFYENKTEECEQERDPIDVVRKFVAAIDLGTTYSGYAFSFQYEPNSIPNSIYMCEWKNDYLLSYKAPTSVLLNKNKEFLAFGYNAETKYANSFENNTDDEDSGDKKDVLHYFRRFKMAFHKEIEDIDFLIEDETGTKMKAIDILTVAITYLKEQIVMKINQKPLHIDLADIYFVLTVPAMWKEKSTFFMRKAAKKAGIKENQLTIAFEPDAASFYCQEFKTARQNESDITFSEAIKTGVKYMVMDLGGTLANITLYEGQQDGLPKTFISSCSSPRGGNAIDDAFLKFIENVVGAQVVKELKSKELEDFTYLLNEFEIKKRSIKSYTIADIVITMPVGLMNIIKKHCGGIDAAIKKSIYRGCIHASGQKLCVNPKTFRDLFKPTITELLKYLKQLFKHPKVSNIQYIIMVGGFSECELVQRAIKDKFPKKIFFIPEEGGLAVLRGAVLYGHRSQQIRRNKLKK